MPDWVLVTLARMPNGARAPHLRAGTIMKWVTLPTLAFPLATLVPAIAGIALSKWKQEAPSVLVRKQIDIHPALA
jgi:hypothetical protein